MIYTSVSSAKKRKKSKPTAKQRELEAAYQELVNKWKSVPKFGGKYGTAFTKAQGKVMKDLKREANNVVLPQLGKLDVGSTAPSEVKVYTGNKLLGVAVVHKSYLAPVFSQQEAEDIAKMRRG